VGSWCVYGGIRLAGALRSMAVDDGDDRSERFSFAGGETGGSEAVERQAHAGAEAQEGRGDGEDADGR